MERWHVSCLAHQLYGMLDLQTGFWLPDDRSCSLSWCMGRVMGKQHMYDLLCMFQIVPMGPRCGVASHCSAEAQDRISRTGSKCMVYSTPVYKEASCTENSGAACPFQIFNRRMAVYTCGGGMRLSLCGCRQHSVCCRGSTQLISAEGAQPGAEVVQALSLCRQSSQCTAGRGPVDKAPTRYTHSLMLLLWVGVTFSACAVLWQCTVLTDRSV
jgi:hypothetical protein